MLALPGRPKSQASHSCIWTLSTTLLILLPRLHDACKSLPPFKTMKIKGSGKHFYGPGERVDYECRPGYKRIPSLPMHTVCNNDGTWTALEEACTLRSCPTPAEPRNGEITNRNGSFLFGSEARFMCYEGYRLLGQEVIYCDLFEHGVDWNDDPPQCDKIYCQPPEKIPNGKYSNSHKEIFEYSEVVTYSCNPSNMKDEFSLIGPKKRVCSGDGEWSGTAPRCQVVVCPYPVVKNGEPNSIIPKKRYYNTKVIFECLQGFVLQGSNIVTCDSDNNWKPALPTCIPDSKEKNPTPITPTRKTSTTVTPSRKTSTTVTPSRKTSTPVTPSRKITTPVTPSHKISTPVTPLQEIYIPFPNLDEIYTPSSPLSTPEDTRPSETPPVTSENLGTEIIVMIVLSIVFALMLTSFGVYRHVQKKK